jgi:plastocyanin
MRRISLVLVVLALAAAIAAASAFAATSTPWKIGTNKTVKIRKGGTVKWVWADGAPHNVKGPGFKSRVMSGKGRAYSHRFGKRGTFKIVCEIHPGSMKTTVKVS